MAFFAVHSMALGKNIQMNTHSIDRINHIHCHFDKGMLSCGVFIDLKKAFDTIDRCILLQKLYHYGIRGIINDWFRSYLTDRVQSTQIGSEVSIKLTTACGVPQVVVLGPLLFLLYVNNLCRSSDKLSFYLFADDTNLLYAGRDINSLERVVNAESSKVLAPAVHGVDSTIHWINHNPLDNAINFDSTYPLDSDLSGR